MIVLNPVMVIWDYKEGSGAALLTCELPLSVQVFTLLDYGVQEDAVRSLFII